jgi:hypothetical protein
MRFSEQRNDNSDSQTRKFQTFCIIQDVILPRRNGYFHFMSTSNIASQWPSHSHATGEEALSLMSWSVRSNHSYTPPSCKDYSVQVTLFYQNGRWWSTKVIKEKPDWIKPKPNGNTTSPEVFRLLLCVFFDTLLGYYIM